MPELVSEHGVHDRSSKRCRQLKLFRALLSRDRQDSTLARERLLSLLKEASHSRPRVNRTLLWVRLVLADIIREQHRTRPVAVLFEDLVEPGVESCAGGDWGHVRVVAEKPSRLVRRGALEESIQARALLDGRTFRWKRPDGLNIMVGVFEARRRTAVRI